MRTRIDKELHDLDDPEVHVRLRVGKEHVTFTGSSVMLVVLEESEGGTHVNGGYFGDETGMGMTVAHAVSLAHQKERLPEVAYWFARSFLEKDKDKEEPDGA